jgi:hypothetical protein
MRISRKFVSALGVAVLLLLACVSGSAQTVTLLSADYGVQGNRMDVTCRVQSMVQNGFLHFRISNYQLGGDPAPELPKEFRIRARDYRGRIYDYNFREGDDVDLQATDRGPNCPTTGGSSPWQGRLTDDDQQRFDSYFTRWLSYRQQNNQGEIVSMQNRMYDVYKSYGIPATVPFSQVASPTVAGGVNSGYSDLQVISASYGIPHHTMDVTARLRGMIQNGSLSVHVNNDSMGGDPAPEKHKVLTLVYSYRGQQRTITVRESDDLRLP